MDEAKRSCPTTVAKQSVQYLCHVNGCRERGEGGNHGPDEIGAHFSNLRQFLHFSEEIRIKLSRRSRGVSRIFGWLIPWRCYGEVLPAALGYATLRLCVIALQRSITEHPRREPAKD